ncbi:hypothetical protein K227x_57990 [Rubripirellula lacrimiformis]|uniref:Sigma 54 modulation protein / S30EA ribosomal protein n=1 Tax=Rubripirellula lacrimiformis TaxID=1930273 RepID=A0A517NJR6_9BACT|nr:hypothetical protein [Rubripirellula lacrimiformis]QDT07372.1 hypothetical protein K227x_57990 [Rubripirellula lacrimiformis]
MQVSVTSSIDRLGSDARGSISRVLQNTLARFSPNITQVSVLVTDENGPRGGVDKVCRVNLTMPGVGPINVTAKHQKVMAAVASAARRARRMVLTKLKRRGSQRRRGRAGFRQIGDAAVEIATE